MDTVDKSKEQKLPTPGATSSNGAEARKKLQSEKPVPAGAKADKDAPKTAAQQLPNVTLPKGGGAIESIGEKFKVNAATGTGQMSIPLPLSHGRFSPQLELSYDSGSGNGPFGFGWSLNSPAITRKTDKGLPQYCDGDESDVYILAGAEDLVPVLDATGARKQLPSRTLHGTTYNIFFYRPRIEGLFSRIERWVAADTGITHWRTISRDDVTALYGYDATSRIADPNDPTKIFSWRISRSFDAKGNLALYTYVAEDSAGIDTTAAHEVNRSKATRGVQTYLQTVQYGNIEPWFPDWSPTGTDPVLPPDWAFYVVFDFGDHTASPPAFAPDGSWALRPDPFSSYRSAFEIRTYRRVERILFFNNFPKEPNVGANCLVRSLNLTYSDQQTPADPHNPIYTMLVFASLQGYGVGPNGNVTRSLPALEFTYSVPVIQSNIVALDSDSAANLPEGIDGKNYQWVDLDGEGLSGILTDAGGGWLYKRNLSANNLVAQSDGSVATLPMFGPVQSVAVLPAESQLGAPRRLLTLGGDGRLDIAELTGSHPGFYKRTEDYDFEPFRPFDALPLIDWENANTKLIDVTGDGLADALTTEDGLFTFHASLGESGYDVPLLVRPPWDEELGPAVVFSDGTETIFVADMTGDGLSDIVRVRNGEACYWPNIGYGRFGAKVTMDAAPRFDSEETFDPKRIRLADIDGTGSADLLYIGNDGVHAWFNQSGNSWSAVNTIAVFPSADQITSVNVFDFLGTGTACLVWSSSLPTQARTPLLYVDLMGGQKPHLLVNAINNLGAETRITYAPSTRFYVADEMAGTPWATRLPFPVQVVERVESFDWIGRNRLVTRYVYHHGYYDGYEREFRGFGMIEQWDTEEFRTDLSFDDGEFTNWDAQSWAPPMHTKTWFHTGAFREAASVSQQYQGEYWIEPALQAPNRAADAAAMEPPDTVIPSGLNPYEIQEAYRALKGHAIRAEVYADDGSAVAGNPYSITETNFTIACVQNMGINLHAVFFASPRESVSFHYERSTDDPRVDHEFTLETDAYGNVTRSVAVGYPRRAGYTPPEPGLSAAVQSALAYDQTRLHVVATEHQYTNAIDDPTTWPDSYRVPLPSATDVAEITGVAPTVKGNGITNLFSFTELDGDGTTNGIWQNAWSGNNDIPYEAIPSSDVDGFGSPAASLTRRFIAQSQTVYRSDDLTALLAVGQLQPLALTGQSYSAALTPGLLEDIFGTLVTVATLTEGGYVQLAGSNNYWVPSGRIYYSTNAADTPAQELSSAESDFFLPQRAVDPFGATGLSAYDSYALLAVSTTDAVGNVTSVANDYRSMQPATITDPNGNRSSVAFDVLGFVTATAVMGKTTEQLGDQLTGFTTDMNEATVVAQFTNPLTSPATLIGNATTRILYDVNAYARTSGSGQPSPPAIFTLSRETHVSDLTSGATTQYQYAFGYSDGFGREIQRKVLFAPGPLVAGGPQVSPRWAGSGWTIFNNKGKPVRRYEPFFTATNAFEFAAQTGVSTVLLYDAAERIVATLHADNTWGKTVFDAWFEQTWDGNDTALIADPRNDADVGTYFQRCLGMAVFTSWYNLRIGGTYGATAADQAAQKDAAQKAAAHAGTFAIKHCDALGRACLAVADNGGGNRYPSRTAYDTEGKSLALIDPLGRRVEEHLFRLGIGGGVKYIAGVDMAGNPLYRINADGGWRRHLNNVVGKAIRLWDPRGHAFRLLYDPAQRPTQHYVSTNGAPETLIEISIYGEGQAAANLCGRIFRHYDMAGYLENTQFDFKGNLLLSTRQLAVAYQSSIDWTPLAGMTTGAQLDAAAVAAGLIPSGDGGRDKFTASTLYDALNRASQLVLPYSAVTKPDVLQHGYDQGAHLLNVDAWLQQAAAPTALLGPATADRHAVTSIQYNARGQRVATAFGNGTTSAYTYDQETFRLTNVTTTRPNTYGANLQVVQDLFYYYDPVGNVTKINDNADTQDVIYFKNQRVDPSNDYTYDPLYRLVTAVGREHLGQTGGALAAPQQVTNDDSFRVGLPQPGDGNAMGVYTESYTYDPIGNVQTVSHQVSSGSWTRRYAYNEASQIVGTDMCNRLSTTSIPTDPLGGPYSARYTYDAHGNMITMPHLPAMTWDEDDRLQSTTRQVVTSGTPVTTLYAYDTASARIRKVTNGQAAPGQNPTRKSERIYLSQKEIYREYAADGTTVSLERETLRIDADSHVVARVETRTIGSDAGSAQLVRYQHSNHLDSAVLELGDQADIISYEEYFPFGSTSYQAVANQTDVPKRYRYTGKERDAENDLYYHGARYYAPWLARWTACDPEGIKEGLSAYWYAHDNPIRLVDDTGSQAKDSKLNLPQVSPSSAILIGRDGSGNRVYVLGTPRESKKGDDEPIEVTVHGTKPKRVQPKKPPEKKEGGAQTAAAGARTTVDSVHRMRYERAIKKAAKDAVDKIKELRKSDAPGDAVKAWETAEEASKFRESARTAVREKLSTPGKALSEAVDKTMPKEFYAQKYTSPPEIRSGIGRGSPPKPPSPEGAYVYEAAEDIARAAGKSRGGIPGALLKSGRYLGPAMLAVGLALSAREIYNAPEGQKGRVAAHEGGTFLGALVGAEIGSTVAVGVAAIVLGATPIGWAAVGIALAGGAAGALLYGSVGGSIADTLYNKLHSP
jgi:RHS repeat-associated protein